MKEELITFETAKLAKEKGFDLEVRDYYHPNYGLTDISDELCNMNGSNWAKGYYSAPTQSLLQKWLREEHNVDISIDVLFADSYGVFIHKNRNQIGNVIIIKVTSENHITGVFENTLEVGLQKALKLT
jgi:hypothetical protein